MVAGIFWTIAVMLLIAVRILISIPAVRRNAGDQWEVVWARIVAWVDPPVEESPDQIAFAAAIRRDQLRRDLLRVDRLLATDIWMPATRQTGNRLAYAWLLGELKRVNATLDACGYLETPAPTWDSTPSSPPRTRGLAYAPRVEVLEIGRWN